MPLSCTLKIVVSDLITILYKRLDIAKNKRTVHRVVQPLSHHNDCYHCHVENYFALSHTLQKTRK
jgi:hypothetical protein